MEQLENLLSLGSGGKTARNPLRDLFLLAMMVTKTCLQEDCGAVTWGDCAVRLLVQVQLKQELELKELIQELAEGLHNNGHLSHQAIPLAVIEGQDPVSNLIQLLQPLTPQEQLHLNQLNMMLPSGQGHLSTEEDEQTQGTTEAEMENEIQADNISQVSMVSENIAGNVVKGGARNQNRYQDISPNNDQRNCLDGQVFRGKPQEQIEKDYHHGQNISPYRKRVMDFSSQTEYKNGHTDIWECTTDRNLTGYQECRGKEVTSEGTSLQGNMEKSPNGPGRATHQMRPSGQTNESEMNVKNRSRHEQVSQNEMTNSVLEATESLIAGLITLKGKVEQVYSMRGTDGQYYQRPGKNISEADAAFTASSQNQTLVTQMEKNVIPSGRGNCDSSSYRERQPQPCKEIQCSRTCDGKGTQAEVSMGHLVPEKQSKAVTIKEEQKQKESYRWEMQSTAVTKVPSNMSCDVGTNPNTKTDIHLQTSSEHLASTVLEAAENLIGSLITLKEEISRVSQSQITREGKGAATATGTQGKQNDTWKEEGIRPQLAQLEGGKASSGNIGKNKSLEEEAMQTCEEDGCDDVPHEPMIREVSWELHPECSHGCNHAKLWDPELNSERDAEKTFESGSKKTGCDNTRRCGDTELPVGSRKDLSMHSSEKGTSVQLGALNAERRELDYEGGEGDVSVPRKQECDEYSSSSQGECGEDTAEPMLLLEDPSNGGCTESDTADQLALSFLEAAQNLIGGLIPGKEETVGRMVVILTDGSAEDGDITLDQGEELSEVSGTISIMEGLSAEDSQASIMSKEDEVRDDSSHFPVNSKKGEVCESDRGCIPSGNNAHQLEECPGGHCTKTELNTQPPLPQSDGDKAMVCLSGCEMMKETTLVVSECRRNEKEDEIAVQKAMTTYGGQEIINPDSNLFVTSNTDCKDNTNNIVTELQPGKEDKLMCGVKMEENNNNLESLAACGFVESSATLHKVCESYGDQRCDATNDIRHPLSQAEDGMDDCAMMAATDRDCGVKIIHSSSREYKETEENKPDKGKYIHQGQSGNQEEGVWKAKEGIITNQDKSNKNDGGNQEEHNDLGPCPSSPDALVRQFLLATDDLIGSLTSLKDSMEKNAKTNSMVITDSISTSTTELGNRQASVRIFQSSPQTFIENTSGDSCSQSTATLSSEKNKELTAEKRITDACDSEKPEEVAVDQDKSKAIEESKEGLCTMKSEREKKEIIQKEDHQQCIFGSDDNNAMPADIKDKRPTETSSHSTLQESCGNSISNIHQTTIENHQESEEQSNCAPSTPGGSVQPVSLSFHDKESLASQEIVPDGQERSINVKNQWRAICEKQILKSHISDRVKIQVEKSKSDFGSYKEMQDSTLLITTAKAGSQLGNVPQLYVGNRDMEKEGSPLSTKPGDEDSSPETNAENTVTEMDGIFREPQDLNNPDSLKDLTVSLMEATSNLIGRLSSLKGQLGSSQANLHSNDNENTQNVLDPTQQRHVPRTSEETIMAQMELHKQISNVGHVCDSEREAFVITNMPNRDQIPQEEEHTDIHNAVILQAMNEVQMSREPFWDMNTDREYNRVMQGLPQENRAHSKDQEHDVGLSAPSGFIENGKICQGETLLIQKDTQTSVPSYSPDGNLYANNEYSSQIQTRHEALQEQTVPPMEMREAVVVNSHNVSLSQISGDCTDGGQCTEIRIEEQYTLEGKRTGESSFQMVCSEHNMNERFTNNVDPKETEFGDPDECIQGVKYEEVQNRKLQESTQIRDLSNIHTLKQYIKNEVTIRKQEDIGDREENIRNPQEESRENLGGFPEYGTTIKRDDGGSVEMDNVKLDSMELASTTDGLLKNREEPDTDKYTAQHNSHEQAMQANYLPETNVLENERRENIKRAEENYGWEEEENSTGQPEHNSDVKREQKTHPCVPTSEQAEDARMKFQTEGAGAMQSDGVLDDIPHVPANGVLVRNEAQLPYPLHRCQQPYIMLRSTGLQDTEQAKPEMKSQLCTVDNYELRASSVPLGQAALQRERVFFRLSLREQQEALRRLQDLHREAELKCTSDRRRQMLRFQERLSIARNRKSEVNLMDITQRRLPQMTPEPRPEGDTERQKSVVRERLEKMKRERTYIMQTRRDRNMSSFRELLDPVLAKDKREDSGSELRGAEGV
ncbi:uncharacterized protein [Hyperolius riggenbachi]|uniref:uncharacterized protein n=1 Tax=Hyperolius riggenbachi TaxID=752182 RepID=UPI0035A2E073